MLTDKADGIPHLRVWQRVWQHPDVRIQPLDAQTLHQSTRARVWVGGEISAYLQRSGEGWELSLPGSDRTPEIYGSTAIDAVNNWLSNPQENNS
jgi:hypothetical protein